VSNDTCCNHSVADLFSRWWLSGIPPPTSGYLLTNPYYEIMVAGNVWLPKDMLYGLVKHSDKDCNTDVRHVGQWGNAAGAQLRAFLQAAGRPLIWADSDDSEMLIDPTVGNIVGGRTTAADIADWESLGESLTDLTPLEQAYRFFGLAESAPPHLKLRCPLWAPRNACAQEELDPLKMVMGTDGIGDCVCWDASRPERWEPLNENGGCARQRFSQPRRLCPRSYSDQVGCVSLPASESGTHVDVAYCVPDATGNYSSRDSCEASCYAWPCMLESGAPVFV